MTAMLIYATVPSREEARRIAGAVVGERLAACANILGETTSLYWWEGAVQEDKEVALILKTEEALIDRLTARVKALHSYTVPCVVALPIKAGNPDYLAWIDKETA